jgi:ribonuclease HII
VKQIIVHKGPSFEIEAGLFRKGYQFIAGVDEAGRGSLAGPLVLGVSIYESRLFSQTIPEELSLVNDSKKLTHKTRCTALDSIRETALCVKHYAVPHDLVDKLNINGATLYALRMMIAELPIQPDCVIMDGNFSFTLSIPFIPVIKGDSRSVTIASASIEAKVSRDRIMTDLDGEYPGYGFSVHKGYGTERHREAIERLGPSAIHRLSYEPVKSMVMNNPELCIS